MTTKVVDKVRARPWLLVTVIALAVLLILPGGSQSSRVQAAMPSTAADMGLGLVSRLAPLAGDGIPGTQCMREATGYNQPTICTANDVRVGEISVVGDPILCTAGQMVEVTLQAKIESSPDRYDIGLWIDQGGGDALAIGNTCYRDWLHPVSVDNSDFDLNSGVGPYWNGELGANQTNDVCGDVPASSAYTPPPGELPPPTKGPCSAGGGTCVYTYHVFTTSILCQDSAPLDGVVDLGACTSWDNQSNKTACTGPLDTNPSTTSKCNCSRTQVGNLLVKPKLIVIKNVTNDNGGTAVASDFTVTVNGTNPLPATFPGSGSPGTTVELDPGTYSVTEDMGMWTGKYAVTYSADCSGSIAAGETKTCTITNNDIPPSLTLIKQVDNTNGGTAAATDWTLTATGTLVGNTFSGTTPVNSPATLKPDTWTLSETGPTGYTTQGWACVGGTQSGSQITLGLGQTATCTIINVAQQLSVDVTKDAATTYTRTYNWTVTKEADATYNGFPGDSWTHTYTINRPAGTPPYVDSAWAATGSIYITNDTPLAATITGVSDSIGGIPAAVNCGVTFPYTLAANGGTLTCTYSATLPDGTNRVNTATVTTSGQVQGGTGTADVVFGDPTTEVNKNPTVIDDNGTPGDPDDDQIFTTFPAGYSRDFACPTDLTEYTDGFYTARVVNTAKVDVTGGTSGIATVTVNCYIPTVTKTAAGAYTRTYTWAITKEADGTYTKLAGESVTHDYTVSVDQTVTDSGFVVSGVITVQNPNPDENLTASVADSVGGAPAVINCGDGPGDTTLTVPANGSATCGYSATVASATPGTNTATVTVNAIAYEATAGYTFTPTTVGSPTINVTDDYGTPGTGDDQAWTANGDDSWTYNKVFICPTNQSAYTNGSYTMPTHVNTATIVETNQSDIATVNLTCTLPALTATKTAAGEYDRTVTWTLTKTVDDDSHTGVAGGTAGSSTWTVTATKIDSGPTNFVVSGEITIVNPSAIERTFSVSDVLGDGTVATVTCPVTGDNTGTVVAGGTVVCTYTASPDDVSATSNTATITAAGNPAVTATADVEWDENLSGYDSGMLSDPRFSYSATISGSTTQTFPETFTCPSNPALYTNGSYSYTATNVATLNGDINLSATENVAVTCTLQPLTVTKTAAGEWDRTVTWELAKSIDSDSLVGFAGGSFASVWTVTAIKTDSGPQNYSVTGTITIVNPAGISQAFTISDVLDDLTAATVTCPVTGDNTGTVAAGGTVECTYIANPENATATLNTATVTAAGNPAQTATATVGWTENLDGYDEGNLIDERFEYNEVIDETTNVDFDETFKCSTDPADYTYGSYSYTETNTATLNGNINLSATEEVAVTCYAPVISKTAVATYDERHEWRVTKTVNPTSQSAFIGDTVSYAWTVVVTEDVIEENFLVAGVITVVNPDPDNEMVVSLADALNTGTAGVITADADCTYAAGLLTVPAGGTATCPYTVEPTGYAAVSNTATATLNQIPFSDTEGFIWAANIINSEVTVDDDQNTVNFPLNITEGGTWMFEEEYSCSTNKTLYADDNTYAFSDDNTATVSELDGDSLASASASTTVNCYVPTISKTAAGAYDERHEWGVEKTVDPVTQDILASYTADFEWTVVVTEDVYEENFAVDGVITVVNTNAEDALVVALADVLDVQSAVTITPDDDCAYVAATGILTVLAGQTATCGYSAEPDDRTATQNTATITLNEVEFDATATVGWTPNVIRGEATLDDDRFAGTPPWPLAITDGGTWEYADSYACPAKTSPLYVDGKYTATINNTAVVLSGDEVQDSSTASTEVNCYYPIINIVKTTEAYSNEGDAIVVLAGDLVTWNYYVTNPGSVPLSNVAVTDDQGVTVTCPQTTLAVGESMTCTATGTASTVPGTWYNNIGTATGSWTDDDGNTGTATDSDPSSYFVPNPGTVTNSSLCDFGEQFRLIFTPDMQRYTSKTPYYKLSDSNPGQFFYNLFQVNDGDPTVETYALEIPYPFVTQGAMPVHVYDSVYATTEGDFTCFDPMDGMAYPFVITLADYTDTNGDGNVGFGDVFLVEVPAEDDFQYINIHLDYGLEKTDGWLKKGSNATSDGTGKNPAPDGLSIVDNSPYTFQAYADGAWIVGSTDTIYNVNEFKQVRGFGGLVYYQTGVDGDGYPVYEPLQGAQVTLTGPKVTETMDTDADGWYLSSFIHNGKVTVYTLELQAGTDPNGVSYSAQTVTVTVGGAVKYGEGSFWIPPMP